MVLGVWPFDHEPIYELFMCLVMGILRHTQLELEIMYVCMNM
jgi:hypothetical protein